MGISKSLVNGKVVYDVVVKTRDSSGKQVSLRRRSVPSEKEAKRIEFEFKKQLDGFKNRIHWSKWIDHFLERYRLEYRNSTYMNYSLQLGKWVTPHLKDRFIDEITPSEIHKIIFEVMTGVSDNTRKSVLKATKRAFNMAIEEGLLAKNPAVGIRVKIVETNQSVLNKNEIDILLREALAVKHRFYHHWCFAILTGMRSGELHALRWSDVDFVTGFISISKSWTRYNGEGPTKTAKNRVCPISAAAREFLINLKSITGNTEYVLPRLWEWDQGRQGQVIREFCTGIGITPITFHDLRATYITQMLNNGAPLSKVMNVVGHSSLKTTQGYLRLCGKDVEGLNEMLAIKLPSEVPVANVVPFRKG